MIDKIFAIAITTNREAIRGKVLYLTMFFAVALVSISALFGKVTLGDQSKVIKDFGLMSLSLFSVLFCVINGATLLHKELSKKTIFNIFSKPVSRTEFLLGKFAGILITTSILLFLMSTLLSGFIWLLDGKFDWMLLRIFAYIWLEIFIVSGFVIFFSSIVVTPMLAGLFSLAAFLSGRSAAYVLQLNEQGPTLIHKAVYAVLPHLDMYDKAADAVYGIVPPDTYLFWCCIYAVSYVTILLTVASMFFKNREFQ